MLSPGAKVFRGTVINSNRLSGEVVVQLGGFGIADNYITISNIGRSPVNGRWKVPEPGDQVYITADDDSLSNPTLLEVWTSDPALMTGDPIGHENRLRSQLAFNNATRTFSISPVAGEHIVWCRGQRFSKRITESVQIPNATDIYFIYYDLNGNLSFKTGVIVNWGTDTPVAYVYWNSSTAEAEFIADERHGITLDWQTHEYLHRTRGSAYANGFGAYGFTTGTSGLSAADSDAQMGLYGGTFFDEDLQVDVVHSITPAALSWEQNLATPAQIPAFYRLSTGWRGDPATTYPLKQGATLPVYNNPATWSNVEISNGKFGITWVVATNGLNPPVLGILGQAEYNNIGEAESANWSSLDLIGLPIVELRPLYKVVYQVGTNYTNTPKAVLRGVYDLRISYSSFGTAPAVQTVDHGALTGLADDDHTQYLNHTRGDARYLQLTGGSVTGAVSVQSLNIAGGTLSTGASVINVTSGSRHLVNNTARFEVTSSGASVNGTMTAASFSGAGTSLTALNASNLSSGTVSSDRVSGSYTGITGIGTITNNPTFISTGTATSSPVQGLQILNNTSGNDALILLHVSGDFAGYFGMGGAENDLVVGGYSYGANNRYKVLHTGNSRILPLPYVKLQRTVTYQQFSGNQDIVWDTESSDTHGYYPGSGATITVPTGYGGIHAITAHVDMEAGISGNGYIILNVDNFEYVAYQITGNNRCSISVTVNIPAGGTIKVIGYNPNTGSQRGWIEVTRLGAAS